MGRGRRGWLPTLEDGQVLDLSDLRRSGLLRTDGQHHEGKLTWTNGRTKKPTLEVFFTSFATVERGWLRLRYAVRQRNAANVQVDETFHLVAHPQPFGGHRLFVVCPSSGRQCRCLYLPRGATNFRSRHGFSLKLQYHSQCLVKHYRLRNRRNHVAEKLFKRGPEIWREIFGGSDVPPRPKGMHIKTYTRLSHQWRLLDAKADAQFERVTGEFELDV